MISIGIDLEDISRIRHIMARNAGFAGRIFTPEERRYCDERGDPAQHYTARFCAKEALIKALGATAPWLDIEVIHSNDGHPIIQVQGKAADLLSGRRVSLSLSHSGGFAIAVILVEE